MSSLIDREIQRQRGQRAAEFEPVKEKLLCRIVRVGGDIKVKGKKGFVWCQEHSPGADDNAFQVFNVKVAPRANLPVWVGLGLSGRLEILDWYNAVLVDLPEYNGEVYLPEHHTDHEWPDKLPGADAVTVYERAIAPLRTYVGEGGSLTVSIRPLRYIHNKVVTTFVGLNNLDISASQPGVGLALYVGIYLNTTTNLIGTVDSSTVSDVPTIDPPSPTFPANAIPSALVRLDNAQTVVSEVDIVDARPFIGDAKVGAQTAPLDATYWVTTANADLTNEFVVPVTDTGDLLVTGAVPPGMGRLGVGTDGQVLTADSVEASGIRWGNSGGSFRDSLFIDGVLSVSTDVGQVVIFDRAIQNLLVKIHCKTTGSSSSTIVDLHDKNGTSIFATTPANRPTLAFNDADGLITSGVPDTASFVENDFLLTQIDQVAVNAADLTILVYADLVTGDVAGLDVIEANFHGGWLESHWTFGGPDEAASLDEVLFFDAL